MYNHHIDTFIAVANNGSFNKAGEVFHLTAASMSKHIDDLESILGEKLFIRGPKGVTLTEQGKVFYAECQKLIRLSEEIIAHTKNIQQPGEETIVIGYSPLAPIDRFNQICATSLRLSKYKIQVISFNDVLNNDRYGSGSTSTIPEIGFGIGNDIKEYADTDFFSICSSKLTCAIPSSHSLTKKTKLSINDLYGETLYFPSRGNARFAQSFFLQITEKHPEIKVEIPSIFYDMDLINTCAVGKKILVAFDIWGNIHPNLVNLPVDWDYKTDYGLIWKKNARKTVLNFVKLFIAEWTRRFPSEE